MPLDDDNFFEPFPDSWATETAGSVSVPQSPAPSSTVGDWADQLGGFTRVVGTVADVFTGFQTARNVAAAARENAAAAREDRALGQFERASQLDLRRSEVAAKTELGKLGLAVDLAKARAAVSSAASPVYQFVSGGAGQWLMLALAGAGVYFAWQQARKR